MANRVAAVALQYSKWLSRFICWIWAIYRLIAVVLAALAHEGTYLVNSLGEKVLYSDRFVLKWLDKEGFKSLIAKAASHLSKNEEEGEEDGDSENG